MKTLSFNEMDIREKASLLYAFGQYMMSVSEKQYAVTLFAIDAMLVEVYYNTDLRQIDRITAANPCDLDKYLSHISIQ